MEHRGYDITVEYLPDRAQWRARATTFPGLAAMGESEAVAVARLQALIDDALAWIAVHPDADEGSCAPHARVPGRCLRNDVPGYSLEEALAAVGPGWTPLVSAAHRRLTTAGGRIVQVKEKFGGLRSYYEFPETADGLPGATRAWSVLDRWASWIETKSLSTCKSCGAAGVTVQRQGWMRTLCAACDGRRQEGARTWAAMRGEIDLDRGMHDDA